MKKILAFILALVMLGSLVVGCTPTADPNQTTGGNSGETTGVKEELAVDHFKGTTIKIAVLKKDTDTSGDWSQKPIVKMAEEATGIHVDWIVVDPATVQDKLASMLMSDDQPDAYLGFFATNENVLSNNLEKFYDLSEEGLLETYAPKVKADYDSLPMLWNAVTWEDGSIRGLVTGGSVPTGAAGAMTSFHAINQEWLDKAQMEVPTTADELYEVLKYFKEHDMDGDGDPNNEIPMTFANGNWEGDLMMYAAAFGIAGNYTWQAHDHYKNIKDGKVVSTLDTDNYRAFLEFFHKLYSEGLLDQTGFSQTADQYSAKRSEKIAGVINTFSTGLDQGYTPFVYQGMAGVDPMISGLTTRFMGLRSNFNITANSENVEATLWWWNWLHKDAETKNIAMFGPNTFYQDEDGNFWENQEVVTAEDYVDTVVGMSNFSPVMLPGEKAQTHPDDLVGASKIRYDFAEANKEKMNQEGFALYYAAPEDVEERGFIESELYPYIQTFMADAIANGLDDAKWDAHLQALKDYGYYDWLDMWQAQEDAAAAAVSN